MARERPSLRLLAALLLAALPPLLVLLVIAIVVPGWIADAAAGTVLLVAVTGTLLWAGLVALVAVRPLAGEARSMATLAERGILRLSLIHI